MALTVMGGGGKGGGREGGGGKGDEEKVHFTKHFTKEGREMSRYYTLVQGKRTGLRSNKLAAPSDAKLVFCAFFFLGSTFEEASLCDR